MDTDNRAHESKLHRRISLGIVAVGVMMMLAMMYFESEPGLLPLGVIVFGIAWYFLARGLGRSRHE